MRFFATGSVVGSKFLGEFEADTVEEALRLAGAEAGASFCHRCSSECEDPEVEVAALTDENGETLWDAHDDGAAYATSGADDAIEDAVEHLAEAMRLLFVLHPELNGDHASADASELRRRIREASGCIESLR